MDELLKVLGRVRARHVFTAMVLVYGPVYLYDWFCNYCLSGGW